MNSQSKLLPDPPLVNLPRLEMVEQRQFDDLGPTGRDRRTAESAYLLQLSDLLVALEEWPLGEQLSEDATANNGKKCR